MLLIEQSHFTDSIHKCLCTAEVYISWRNLFCKTPGWKSSATKLAALVLDISWDIFMSLHLFNHQNEEFEDSLGMYVCSIHSSQSLVLLDLYYWVKGTWSILLIIIDSVTLEMEQWDRRNEAWKRGSGALFFTLQEVTDDLNQSPTMPFT